MKRFTSYPHMSQEDLNQELWDACYKGDLEQLQYVLHSPELKIHGDMYYDNGDCFFWAYSEKHMDVVNYLLYEEHYEFHEKLKKKCDLAFAPHPIGVPKFTLQEINELFGKRDLYFQLKDLPSNSHHKMVKI